MEHDYNFPYDDGQLAIDIMIAPDKDSETYGLPEPLPRKKFSAEPVRLEDTVTYKALDSVKKMHISTAVSGVLLTLLILTGIVAAVRFASIFNLTTKTRRITSANTAAANRLVLEKYEEEGNIAASRNVSEIAARLGMVKATGSKTITIDRSGGTPVRIYVEEESTEESKNFLERIRDFLGIIESAEKEDG